MVRAHATDAGRDPGRIDTAVYLTIDLADDPPAGEAETSAYAESYCGIPYDVMRKAQAYFVGDAASCVEWLRGFVDAGVRPLLLRVRDARPDAAVRARRRPLAGARPALIAERGVVRERPGGSLGFRAGRIASKHARDDAPTPLEHACSTVPSRRVRSRGGVRFRALQLVGVSKWTVVATCRFPVAAGSIRSLDPGFRSNRRLSSRALRNREHRCARRERQMDQGIRTGRAVGG